VDFDKPFAQMTDDEIWREMFISGGSRRVRRHVKRYNVMWNDDNGCGPYTIEDAAAVLRIKSESMPDLLIHIYHYNERTDWIWFDEWLRKQEVSGDDANAGPDR